MLGNIKIYLAVKHKAKKAIFRQKKEAHESQVKKLNNLGGRQEVFQIAWQVSNSNRDILVGEHCIREIIGN